MNKAEWEKIEKIAQRVKAGEKFSVVFPKRNKKFLGHIASKDGRTVRYYDKEIRSWRAFGISEILLVFDAKIKFLKEKK